MLTLALETAGAIAFIERSGSKRASIVALRAHRQLPGTASAPRSSARARISTHLGNGSHAMLPRHENYLWEQLADDRLWASMIADGHHLPESVMRCILRVKTPAHES